MQPSRDRLARKHEFRGARERSRPAARRLRWALVLATAALLVGGAASAQAAPGGASSVTYGGSDGQELAFSPFKSASASWYGPGLYGNSTACGVVLRPTTIGVAHRSLPCGTMVKFAYHGHAVIAPVIDRGPFVKGRAWDLTAAASEALEFDSADMLRYAVAVEYARPGAPS